MADVLVSALLSVLMKKATDQVLRQFGVMWGIDEKLEELGRKLGAIQSKIGNAEERQGEDHVKHWLEALKDAAYQAEDILDEFNVDANRLEAGNQAGMMKKVRNFFSSYNPGWFRFQIGRKLNHIIKKINKIITEGDQFHFIPTIQPQNRDRPQTHSYVDESTVIGREEDKENVVNLLLDHHSSHNVAVLPIVGMGGLGKTTLAQLVYKDERVEKDFQPLIWVCVSEEFEVAKLAKKIITSATGEECNLSTMQLLQCRLREVLGGKRYFLVLDDVWNHDSEKWNGLKTLLETGKKGSKIIVTTRREEVARRMGTIPSHYPQQLNENDSWTLFKKRAFKDGVEEPQNLVSIGKEIVKKCDGLPLAVNVVGALMHSKSQEEAEWLSVKDSEIWNSQAGRDEILPVLRLSYCDLPSYLKQCFAFCAIFPKDHVMEKEMLIQLWMANGFIPSDEGKELQDKGNEIFNELAWRSFFQDIQQMKFKSPYTSYWRTTCEMHDLMHDLAQSIMGNECLSSLVHVSWEHIYKKTRHLYISTPNSQLDRQRILNNFPNVRTLLIPDQSYRIVVAGNSLKSIPLRALKLNHANITKLFDAIRFLKHLRYLDLSYSVIEKLPEATSTLFNLQTLKLSCCQNLRKLPDGMKNMSNLRHLYINGCKRLEFLPTSMGQLRNLRTLTNYIVSNENGRGIDELNGLNLGGTLELYNLRNVKNIADAKKSYLNSKHNLCSLLLCWDMVQWSKFGYEEKDVASVENAEEVLEGLRPHVGLKQLTIFRYGGTIFPMWMKDSQLLQNLVEIHLVFCTGCEHFPPLWQSCSLQYLYLEKMDKVKHICSGNESNGTVQAFPSLKRLKLLNMQSLKAWLKDDGTAEVTLVFPCLEILEIIDCHNLMSMPELPSLQSLKVERIHIPLGFWKNLASLQDLSIDSYDNLIYWPKEEFRGLNSLKSLSIIRCKNLIGPLPLPSSSLLPSSSSSSGDGELLPNLENLKIINCEALLILPKLPISLISFEVYHCSNLSSLTEGGLQHLTALTSLSIEYCRSLTSLPIDLGSLTALRSLNISNCDQLQSFPEGLQQRLPSLRYLDISECPNLASLPIDLGSLAALQRLQITNCDLLQSLLEGFQQRLPSLRYLDISGCPNLASLPIDLGSLTALQSLQITNCDLLQSLPEGFQQRLPSLQLFHIEGCPNLRRQLYISGLDREEASEFPSSRVISDRSSLCSTFLPSFRCFRRASTV